MICCSRHRCRGNTSLEQSCAALILIWLQVERGSIWCFEQEQSLGGTNVSTNVRMTVIKLKSGGLFVHAPIAATR